MLMMMAGLVWSTGLTTDTQLTQTPCSQQSCLTSPVNTSHSQQLKKKEITLTSLPLRPLK